MMKQGTDVTNGDPSFPGAFAAASLVDTLTETGDDRGSSGAYPSIFTDLVIPELVRWRRQGIDSALVTLVGIEGSSPRRIGSQLAVSACGRSVGYISGGCAEKAIIAEAIEAISQRKPRTIRYGRGSKYLDVVLPCGSGIDIHVDPLISTATLENIDRKLQEREAVDLVINLQDAERVAATAAGGTVPSLAPTYVKRYRPLPRLVVAGRGVHTVFMVRLAYELNWKIVVASPDETVIRRTWSFAENSHHLTRPGDFDPSIIDSHTAVVLLFHDHDWEPEILAKCQNTKAFYIGAMGSRSTHERRKSILNALGLPERFISSIHGPAGLDLKASTPPEIALSILSEVLANAPGG